LWCNGVIAGGLTAWLVFDEKGVAIMGIETAFLAGVLVGQWVMFFAMWRYVARLMKQLTLRNTELHNEPPSGGEVIDISPDAQKWII
jgi:hypothetical protein